MNSKYQAMYKVGFIPIPSHLMHTIFFTERSIYTKRWKLLYFTSISQFAKDTFQDFSYTNQGFYSYYWHISELRKTNLLQL